MEDKWSGFGSDRYRLQNLGRPAVFLVPLKKLAFKIGDETVEDQLHRFLIKQFGAFTTSAIPGYGVYTDPEQKVVLDESREYKVSFNGKERIPLLIDELARIAALVGEDCIYLEAGQYACLVYPR